VEFYVLDTDFWDVVLWMIIGFFFLLFISMFISVFADIFRRDDLSGWAKAGWSIFIFVLPLIGILIYIIARPAITPSDERMIQQQRRLMGASPADEIAKAQQLLTAGTISQAEFDEIKRRALA
jgi:uncharacterized membrane protein